ncbi:MAG: NAD(P)H-binding protein [Pseudomonadota bacterium]
MKILVVGGGGMIGAPVVRRLSAEGHSVCVLSRDPSRLAPTLPAQVQILKGDATHLNEMRTAARGVDAIHISLSGSGSLTGVFANEVEGVRIVVEAAKAEGVSRVTYVSGAGDLENLQHLPFPRLKLMAERHLSVFNGHTVFRPTHVMESLRTFIRKDKAIIFGAQPNAYHYLSADDFAGVVAAALKSQVTRNATVTVLGPEPFRMEEALRIYRDICAPHLTVQTTPIWPLKIIAALTRNERLNFATTLFSCFAKMPEAANPGGPEVAAFYDGGFETLRRWCERQTSP